MFKYPLSKVTKFTKMNEKCGNCGVTFEPEPGFYFGAMFVSYAFSVALFAILSVILYVFFQPSDWVYLLCITLSAVLFTPFSFRYSRILFLYFFGGINYDRSVG